MNIASKLLQRLRIALGMTPVAISGATLTASSVFDRQAVSGGNVTGANTLYIVLSRAAPTGTPTAATALYRVFSNAANSTSGGTLLATLMNNSSVMSAGVSSYAIDLSAAKRYIYTEVTYTFTGGTTPAIITAQEFVSGDADHETSSETIYGR